MWPVKQQQKKPLNDQFNNGGVGFPLPKINEKKSQTPGAPLTTATDIRGFILRGKKQWIFRGFGSVQMWHWVIQVTNRTIERKRQGSSGNRDCVLQSCEGRLHSEQTNKSSWRRNWQITAVRYGDVPRCTTSRTLTEFPSHNSTQDSKTNLSEAEGWGDHFWHDGNVNTWFVLW